MKRMSFLLHALSPLHCGTGQGVDIIDLPIARMHSTGIPFVPGSSLKGVMRDAAQGKAEEIFAVYGPDTANASDNAGALVIGDARLLLLPVRSFFGTFCWVTSPLLLHLAARDFESSGLQLPSGVPAIVGRGARVAQANHANVHNGKVYLQDLDLNVTVEAADSLTDQWLKLLATLLPESERPLLNTRFAIIDDETMTFLWETAMQVDARNRINERGVVVDGALWYEESLPPESILVGQFAAEATRRNGVSLSPDQVIAFALPAGLSHTLQVGGKATVGRGICKIYTPVTTTNPE